MPGFLGPVIFVLAPTGQGWLLMGSAKALAAANWGSVAEVTVTAVAGIFALAVGFQGWLLGRATVFERVLFCIAGFTLAYPGATADVVGFGLVLIALACHWRRGRTPPPAVA